MSATLGGDAVGPERQRVDAPAAQPKAVVFVAEVGDTVLVRVRDDLRHRYDARAGRRKAPEVVDLLAGVGHELVTVEVAADVPSRVVALNGDGVHAGWYALSERVAELRAALAGKTGEGDAATPVGDAEVRPDLVVEGLGQGAVVFDIGQDNRQHAQIRRAGDHVGRHHVVVDLFTVFEHPGLLRRLGRALAGVLAGAQVAGLIGEAGAAAGAILEECSSPGERRGSRWRACP